MRIENKCVFIENSGFLLFAVGLTLSHYLLFLGIKRFFEGFKRARGPYFNKVRGNKGPSLVSMESTNTQNSPKGGSFNVGNGIVTWVQKQGFVFTQVAGQDAFYFNVLENLLIRVNIRDLSHEFK